VAVKARVEERGPVAAVAAPGRSFTPRSRWGRHPPQRCGQRVLVVGEHRADGVGRCSARQRQAEDFGDLLSSFVSAAMG
jgi:hypothetical protein